MLPDKVLSTREITAAFLRPRNIMREPLVDYDEGGIGLQDPSQGLRARIWRAEVVGADVVLSAEGVEPVVVFTQPGITEIAVTFDQNMQPFLAYMIDGIEARFRWFDPTLPGFVVTTLPAGSYSPRCALDDKRQNAGTIAGASDIILTYLRDGALYFRAQRDRYEVEYELVADLDHYMLGQFGMNRAFRMQWQLVPVIPNPTPEISAIDPSSALEGADSLTLTVTGDGFLPQSRVYWDGQARSTTYVSPMELRAQIPAGDLLVPGEVDITVVNPLPGGGESEPRTFTVTETFFRLTEGGDLRITEDGDLRELEH